MWVLDKCIEISGQERKEIVLKTVVELQLYTEGKGAELSFFENLSCPGDRDRFWEGVRRHFVLKQGRNCGESQLVLASQ